PLTDFGGKTSIFSHPVYLFLRKFSLQDSRGGSVIPMLDILVWAAVKKIRVSDDRLSRLLYTDDDEESEMRQSSQIKDTDRPLALKSCTTDFIRQFHYFMNKNSHLKQMKVSDVMKLSD
ncbi:DUF6387 family protein, partial [Escherichia coli]